MPPPGDTPTKRARGTRWTVEAASALAAEEQIQIQPARTTGFDVPPRQEQGRHTPPQVKAVPARYTTATGGPGKDAGDDAPKTHAGRRVSWKSMLRRHCDRLGRSPKAS